MKSLTTLIGLPACGKTTICDVLASTADLPAINLGDLVWTAVQNAGLEPKSRPHAGDLFVLHFPREELGRLALQA
jgi:adenylate kinase family enzyme